MGHWSQGWVQDFAKRGSPESTLALDNPLSAKHTILGGGGGGGGGGMHPQKIFWNLDALRLNLEPSESTSC